MKRRTNSQSLLLACGVATTLVIASSAQAQDPTDFEALRTALGKYQDVNVAIADGYLPDPDGDCVATPAGGMGIHYANAELLQITSTDPVLDGLGINDDPFTPGMLLYEPQADGTVALVGIELLVFQDAWAAAGNEGPPMFEDTPWEETADDPATERDEAHGYAPHFDIHIWVFRENPAGPTQPFNPNVTCEHGTD